MVNTLGILAGEGPFPGQVAAAARDSGRPVFIIGFEGYAEPAIIGSFPHAYVRVGAAGRILELLRAHHCQDLVLVGPIKRPSLLDLRPDAEGARLLTRIGRAAFAGDDGLLAAVVRILAEEGFNVLGAHEILASALGPPGLHSACAPDEQALSDIARGQHVLRLLGEADIGQACVVQAGCVLAVEAIEGTDRMIARAGDLKRPGPGGVLIKMPKPNQDRRADLPTIGPNTLLAAQKAGLRGIAYEAGGTMITDLAACIAKANSWTMFLIGLAPTD